MLIQQTLARLSFVPSVQETQAGIPTPGSERASAGRLHQMIHRREVTTDEGAEGKRPVARWVRHALRLVSPDTADETGSCARDFRRTVSRWRGLQCVNGWCTASNAEAPIDLDRDATCDACRVKQAFITAEQVENYQMTVSVSRYENVWTRQERSSDRKI